MSHSGKTNPWAEINGGIRGSVLLKTGAAMTILATLQNLAATYLENAPDALVSSGWLCWIMALWFLAAGFIWIGVHPFLGRFGWVVGGFHFLNGLVLLSVIFFGVAPFLPNVSLSIGRTLLLLFFVLMEKPALSSLSIYTMVFVSLLQFLKISLRIMEILPSLGEIGNSGIDAILLTLLAAAIFLVAKDIKNAENSWATELASNRTSGFRDFNNPEHDWNRGKE